MARVAANQNRSEALRKQYVFKQHIHILTHKPGGKLMREETADYNVVPTPDGTRKKLTLLTGRNWHKERYEQFTGEPTPEEDSFDGDLISDLRDDLSDDKAKDGLARRWFPLTSQVLSAYALPVRFRTATSGFAQVHLGCRHRSPILSLF